MDEETFNTVTAGTTKQYDVNIRQVSNGFALAGNVRYVDPATQTVKVAQAFEAIATNAAAAVESANNFLTTGSFVG